MVFSRFLAAMSVRGTRTRPPGPVPWLIWEATGGFRPAPDETMVEFLRGSADLTVENRCILFKYNINNIYNLNNKNLHKFLHGCRPAHRSDMAGSGELIWALEGRCGSTGRLCAGCLRIHPSIKVGPAGQRRVESSAAIIGG